MGNILPLTNRGAPTLVLCRGVPIFVCTERAFERSCIMSHYKQTAEHTYEDADGTVYDLTALDDLNDGRGGYLHFKATRGETEVEIITNHAGEGRWEEVWTPFGPDYKQVLGTLQYRIPDTDRALCAQLHKMINRADQL